MGPEELQRQTDAMHTELSSFQGLDIPEQHVKNVERVLDFLSESAIMSETHADLGMVIASLLHKDDAMHAMRGKFEHKLVAGRRGTDKDKRCLAV